MHKPGEEAALVISGATVWLFLTRMCVRLVALLINGLSGNSSLTRSPEPAKRRDFLGFNPTEALNRLDSGWGVGGSSNLSIWLSEIKGYGSE